MGFKDYRIGKKCQLFGFFISSSAAPWRADSKNIYMSISRNCKFPEVFRIFDQLAIIFAMDMYIFLESVGQGAADEPIKTTKS